MTEADYIQARNALKQWFMSQDIQPPDAGIVMSLCIAEQMVIKTQDTAALSQGINLFRSMLTINIANELRR